MKYRTSVDISEKLIIIRIHNDNGLVCNIDFNKEELEKIGNRYDVTNNNFIRFATSDLEQVIFSVLSKAQNAIGLTEYKRNKLI